MMATCQIRPPEALAVRIRHAELPQPQILAKNRLTSAKSNFRRKFACPAAQFKFSQKICLPRTQFKFSQKICLPAKPRIFADNLPPPRPPNPKPRRRLSGRAPQPSVRVMTPAIFASRSIASRLTTRFWRHPKLLLTLLLTPPLLWLGLVYLGALAALLVQSFYALDDFSGLIVPEFTLKTYAQLFTPSNLAIITRTLLMAASVTLAASIIAFPVAYYAARYARGRWKAAFYLGVMLPLWSSYLVKVYAFKLILAKEGILTWAADATHLSWLMNAALALPGVGGNSLSTSYIGTFTVFCYVWLPYMILPMQAALERVPVSMLEAAADLGATANQTFRTVTLPLALPGIIAGSIFTFSLTLGDYIIPQIIGNSANFIGMAVYQLQGTAGNVPLAAAFAVVPILIMLVYLTLARKAGAFDAL